MKLFEQYNNQEIEAFVSHDDEAYFLPPEMMNMLADSVNCIDQCCACGAGSCCYSCGCCASCCTGDWDMFCQSSIASIWPF